ncbi:hypothetical protein LX15_002053 [Streptoalloteichus tenebrarius]|uniref:Mycothiol-dependent maleylpyruvate isomerase metal-binding domain-containing protein n=1 Tax=Streptoalloteichus tenebrarius (strain ATCC 17920 / DSM 40477 / JCM 4838 / CBS 697.72 / NBRC 16177 / NCIMB 11028 / NRRL B-12390 / A12253. 1 / ISP 5477) TaxID=1933 RepID=A0ABT1HS61_STRSD|nr:hypothetical protein [Streptoalloteichus tenebrarius]MCP2258359.1 hypothetical protein [Streptoalloteichus tenebrarius]BFF03526.1 hypothetical protein GCM10020241_52010 [Streptoalloteichus tenebrarius]
MARDPFTPDDLETAVELVVTALRPVADTASTADWGVPAGDLEWDCRATAEHLVDDMFGYAAQVGGTMREGYLPFRVVVDADASPSQLLGLVRAGGRLLASAIRCAPADLRAYHPWGTADAEGYAAMGAAEVLVHGADLASGLGVRLEPPAGVCRRLVGRLFPDAPEHPEPWPLLLWCTGRTALPGVPRRASWRWYGEPPDERPSIHEKRS